MENFLWYPFLQLINFYRVCDKSFIKQTLLLWLFNYIEKDPDIIANNFYYFYSRKVSFFIYKESKFASYSSLVR